MKSVQYWIVIIMVWVFVDKKPTRHENKCDVCHREIQKGEYRLVARYNGWHTSASTYYHIECLFKWMIEQLHKKEYPYTDNLFERVVAEVI